MSDSAPAPTVTESTPTSTADVASNVIDAFEATETTGSEAREPATATTDPPVEMSAERPAPAVVAPPLSDAEKLLHEAGYKSAKKPDGRDNYIPHSKVVKIIENGINQGKGEFGQRYQALETEAVTLRDIVGNMQRAATGDPRAFLEDLASHDPRYRAFLEPPAAAQPPAPQFDGDMPDPDYQLPDGSRTYSLDGIQKQLIPWLTSAITKQLEGRVDEKLKPWTEREKAEQARAEQQQVMEAIGARTRDAMTEAQKWPMFGALPADGSLTEFQSAVLKRMQDDTAAAKAANRRPSMTLKEAYLEEKSERLTPDYNKMRGKVLEELQSAPRGTAVARTGGESPRASAALSTSDVAARTLARLEKGA